MLRVPHHTEAGLAACPPRVIDPQPARTAILAVFGLLRFKTSSIFNELQTCRICQVRGDALPSAKPDLKRESRCSCDNRQLRTGRVGWKACPFIPSDFPTGKRMDQYTTRGRASAWTFSFFDFCHQIFAFGKNPPNSGSLQCACGFWKPTWREPNVPSGRRKKNCGC